MTEACRRVDAAEVERRYSRVRAALEAHDLDAVIVSGSEYTGFEGAVTYMSGFVIVHRYAYVVLPREGDPAIVFPSEARYVGEHRSTWIEEQAFVDLPGEWIRERARSRAWGRVGVYGLDYVMTVRDYAALAAAGGPELVRFDVEFDLARAVKSDAELDSVRASIAINEDGFWTFLEAYQPGKTEAELLAPCERLFVERGCGRLTMDMVLAGANGSAEPEFKIASASRRVEAEDLLLPSLEIAGPGGHWVEFSRPVTRGAPSRETSAMLEAYEEYFDAARSTMRDGASAHDVHRAVSKGFVDRGFQLGHVTGHSIGMTMIEFPKIGEGVEAELRTNMVLSMHPHSISPDGRSCLYMQDTWLVGEAGAEPLAKVPLRIFDGTERRA
ncbi:MAG: M24 family metallopeptidase [Actinomycetota bacterium]|nr:M24 family metallopeptidase [Actinomycetota bacterium]